MSLFFPKCFEPRITVDDSCIVIRRFVPLLKRLIQSKDIETIRLDEIDMLSFNRSGFVPSMVRIWIRKGDGTESYFDNLTPDWNSAIASLSSRLPGFNTEAIDDTFLSIDTDVVAWHRSEDRDESAVTEI